jgi:hypothetical protein
MTIDRPSADILIFDPPHQSIQHFRVAHRLAIILVLICLFVAFLSLLSGSILSFYVTLRYQINGVNQANIIIIAGLCGIFISLYNSLGVYIICRVNEPVLVQSCAFDLHAGELSIQQYNLFDRHQRTIRIPLNTIIDIQVRNYPILMLDGFSAISLMTKKSSKPVYLFQNVSSREISTSTMRSLLEEVITIRKFLHLPSEPPYMIVKHPRWYQILFATPISNELIRSIDQNNNELIYNLQSRQYRSKVSWNFDAIAQRIKIESQTLIGTRAKYITRLEIKSIAIKTEFLPIEVSTHKLIRSAHKRQYQKQYSAILMPSNLDKLNPQQCYWRIFTSTDLPLVRDLVDRVQVHLDLPLDELRSTESIALEPTGAVK